MSIPGKLGEPASFVETSQGTETGPFFYDLLPLAREIAGQANNLQGQIVSNLALAGPLEEAVGVFSTALNEKRAGDRPMTCASLVMVISGCPKAPEEYLVRPRRSDPGPSVRLKVPLSAITGVTANPRISGGPVFHDALAGARKAVATESKYTQSHKERATCSEIYCNCHIGAVDPRSVRMDVSPVIDMRIRSNDDPNVGVYSGQGNVAERPSPGRWYRFPLDGITKVELTEERLTPDRIRHAVQPFLRLIRSL